MTLYFEPPNDRKLGHLPDHIVSAVDLDSKEVSALLTEEIQNAGRDSVVKKPRAVDGTNVVDVISPSLGFSLFKNQLNLHRQSEPAKQNANNEAWEKLVSVEPSFATEVESFKTLVGGNFDWLEVDWATLGRAIGSAVAEVMRAPPYDARITTTRDFSISIELMKDLRDQQPELGGQLSAAKAYEVIRNHGARTESATEASLLRAGTSPSTPVFLHSSTVRLNPAAGLSYRYIQAYPYGGGGAGGATPPERMLETLAKILKDFELETADFYDVLMYLHGVSANFAHRTNQREHRIGMHPMAWMFNRFMNRGVDHLCLQDYVSSQPQDSRYPVYAVFHILASHGVIVLGTSPVP